MIYLLMQLYFQQVGVSYVLSLLYLVLISVYFQSSFCFVVQSFVSLVIYLYLIFSKHHALLVMLFHLTSSAIMSVLNIFLLFQFCNNFHIECHAYEKDIGIMSCGLLLSCVCLNKKSLKSMSFPFL